MSPLLLRLALGGVGLLVAAGVALRLVPPLTPSAPAGLAIDSAASTSSPRPGDSVTLGSYGSIIEKSIFSPGRAAPAERFIPPNVVSDERPQKATSGASPRQGRPPRRFRLVGVALGPMGGVAIIDTDPSTPGADVFRVGDRIGTARVVEIREDAVVLETPGGRVILTLPPSIRRSP